MLTLLLAAAVLLFLDQWSKRIVRHRFAHRSVDLGRSVRIRRVITVKGMYQRWGVRVALVLVWFVALACTAALHVSGATLQSLPSLWGVGAALGGAAGNLVDILPRQAVVDSRRPDGGVVAVRLATLVSVRSDAFAVSACGG